MKLLTAALAPLYASILVKGLNAFKDEMLLVTEPSLSIISCANTCDGINVPIKFKPNMKPRDCHLNQKMFSNLFDC